MYPQQFFSVFPAPTVKREAMATLLQGDAKFALQDFIVHTIEVPAFIALTTQVKEAHLAVLLQTAIEGPTQILLQTIVNIAKKLLYIITQAA